MDRLRGGHVDDAGVALRQRALEQTIVGGVAGTRVCGRR